MAETARTLIDRWLVKKQYEHDDGECGKLVDCPWCQYEIQFAVPPDYRKPNYRTVPQYQAEIDAESGLPAASPRGTREGKD